MRDEDASAQATEAKPVEIEREIEALRRDLDALVDELDRRRHDSFDWRLQLRKHARPIALVAFVVVGGVLLGSRARRHRLPASLGERIGMRLQGRSAERAPSLTAQLGRTAALGLASVAARHVAERAITGARERSSAPPANA